MKEEQVFNKQEVQMQYLTKFFFQLLRYKKKSISLAFVCAKELHTLHTRLTKLVLLCQKSQQTLSAPYLKLLLLHVYLQTTKYLITSVNDIEIEHLSLGSVNYSYFILFSFCHYCHSSSFL